MTWFPQKSGGGNNENGGLRKISAVKKVCDIIVWYLKYNSMGLEHQFSHGGREQKLNSPLLITQKRNDRAEMFDLTAAAEFTAEGTVNILVNKLIYRPFWSAHAQYSSPSWADGDEP